jgi:hypothetical protein
MEIPSCTSTSNDLGEVVEDVYYAIEDHIAIRNELGLGLPKPAPKEHSGKLLLRLPKTLHRGLANRATREGVSINQYIAVSLSHVVMSDSLIDEARKAMRNTLDDVYQNARLNDLTSPETIVSSQWVIPEYSQPSQRWKNPPHSEQNVN